MCILRKQVEEGIDPTSKDEEGRTAMSIIVDINHLDALEFLVEQGASVSEAIRESDETPLHVLASTGFLEGVEFMLDHGADVNAPTTYNDTPLHHSLYHLKVVRLLVERGVDIEAQAKRPRLGPDTLCSLGCEEGTKECLEHRSWLALHLAVMLPARETAELLLDLGANLDAVDGEGRSVLCNALSVWSDPAYDECSWESEPMVRMLVSRGPKNISLPPQIARRALCMSAANGCEDIARFLIGCGAHIEAAQHQLEDTPYRRMFYNPTWTNPLFAAARNKKANISHLLIDAGMDVNPKGSGIAHTTSLCCQLDHS